MVFNRSRRSRRNSPLSTAASSSLLVAEMNRTLMLRSLVAPTGLISRLSIARSSLACMVVGMSPISSRHTVPPLADSSRPALVTVAPVKAPRSWPNSSLSSTPSDSAAQLKATNGCAARGDSRWISCARTSLPTPHSPRIRTLMDDAATRVARLRTRCMAATSGTPASPRSGGGPGRTFKRAFAEPSRASALRPFFGYQATPNRGSSPAALQPRASPATSDSTSLSLTAKNRIS